jgi:hypothetical protein
LLNVLSALKLLEDVGFKRLIAAPIPAAATRAKTT